MKSPRARDRERITTALREFVIQLVGSDRFDFIVPVERKGTALIRSAMEGRSVDEWRRIISSAALEASTEKLRGARILLFDDSVWRGRSLGKAIERVRKFAPDAKITTAACMSHVGAPDDLLQIVYYRSLDDDAYDEKRAAVVEFLQYEGSLLLDTEHLEVEMTVDAPLPDIFGAMAGWGQAVLFPSAAHRINCTLVQDPLLFSDKLKSVVPQFADLNSSVCKVRVISQPGDAQRFALIPICYPALYLDNDLRYTHPRMSWTKRVQDQIRIFQAVGLSLSTELLLDFVEWMKLSLPEKVAIDYHRGLGHLLPVFPEIDFGEIEAELQGLKRHPKPRTVQKGHFDDQGLENIKYLANELMLSCFDTSSTDGDCLRSLTVHDIVELAKLNGQPYERASAAIDLLIDNAQLLPAVQTTTRGARTYTERVFGPDGEVVRRQLIRNALLQGKGLALVTG